MTTITQSADLPVTPDEAFALITEPERLRRWQAVSASIELRAGGSYRWTVTPGNIASGTVREVEPGRRVVLAWGWEHAPDLDSTVTITVEPTESGSRVTLVHEGLPEEQVPGHEEGWTHFLGRLEQVAESGDAGPDEWAYAPENLTPMVAAEAALAVLQPVLRNLKDSDRSLPTPCDEFDCQGLVEHLIGSLAQLGQMVGEVAAPPAEGSLEDRVSVTADRVITAWRGADLESTIETPNGPVPAGFLAAVLPLELVLHGWDLAQGSGQRQHISDEVVAYVREITSPVIENGRGSSFADPVETGADASAVDQFAASAGRTPIAP